MKNVFKKALWCFGLVFIAINVNAKEHRIVNYELQSFKYKQEGKITYSDNNITPVLKKYNPTAKVWKTSGACEDLDSEVSSFRIVSKIEGTIGSDINVVGYNYQIMGSLYGDQWYCFVLTWEDDYNKWEYRYYITPLADVWDPTIVATGYPCVGAPTAKYSISDNYSYLASSTSYTWRLGAGGGVNMTVSNDKTTASLSSLTTTSSFSILCDYSITTSVWGTLSKTNLSRTVTPYKISSYGSFPMDEFEWDGNNRWMGNVTPINGSVSYSFTSLVSGGSGTYSYENYFGTDESPA